MKKSKKTSSASLVKPITKKSKVSSTVLNMEWGNPAFLYPIWNHVPEEDILSIRPGDYHFGSDDDLKNLILELHFKTHDFDSSNYDVVIGNGATQVLQAALWALGEIDVEGPLRVSAVRPYYPRFPDIVKLAGGKWTTDYPNVAIVTSPNNPDGEFQDPPNVHSLKHIIHDYSYNWLTYTDFPERLNKNIMVFSLAKATGHADMRIGWALVRKSMRNSKKIKHLMETNIEYSTGGVSKQSQEAAFSVLATVSDHYEQFFSGAMEKLRGRWERIEEIEENLPFTITNASGMFIWAEGKCPKKLKSKDGFDFGILDGSMFRLNIGCDDDIFNAFIDMYKDKDGN